MRVNEIFYSIQGEGNNIGIPTVFCRLAGCNLRPGCVWCDTTYAQRTSQGEELSTQDIVERIGTYKRSSVCITGGEPLCQSAQLRDLVESLSGLYVEVFTNGTVLPPEWYKLVNSWVVDFKCPSSGIVGKSAYNEWCDALRDVDMVKFVVADRADLRFVEAVTRIYGDKCNAQVMISPMISDSGIMICNPWYDEVVEFCKERDFRFGIQIHKILWGNKAGV